MTTEGSESSSDEVHANRWWDPVREWTESDAVRAAIIGAMATVLVGVLGLAAVWMSRQGGAAKTSERSVEVAQVSVRPGGLYRSDVLWPASGGPYSLAVDTCGAPPPSSGTASALRVFPERSWDDVEAYVRASPEALTAAKASEFLDSVRPGLAAVFLEDLAASPAAPRAHLESLLAPLLLVTVLNPSEQAVSLSAVTATIWEVWADPGSGGGGAIYAGYAPTVQTRTTLELPIYEDLVDEMGGPPIAIPFLGARDLASIPPSTALLEPPIVLPPGASTRIAVRVVIHSSTPRESLGGAHYGFDLSVVLGDGRRAESRRSVCVEFYVST